LEARHAAGRDLDALPGSRIPAAALGASRDQERAKTTDGDLPTLAEGVDNLVQEHHERALGRNLRATGRLGHDRHELSLRHGLSYLLERNSQVKRLQTVACDRRV